MKKMLALLTIAFILATIVCAILWIYYDFHLNGNVFDVARFHGGRWHVTLGETYFWDKVLAAAKAAYVFCLMNAGVFAYGFYKEETSYS